ncbi:MAG: hypothetical protein D4R73_11685 [Deltaproteobacteria bacterium]|nr:MAG: hypothetical protein D4R73_11685 [Deltaproteobacteria bacterium]
MTTEDTEKQQNINLKKSHRRVSRIFQKFFFSVFSVVIFFSCEPLAKLFVIPEYFYRGYGFSSS